MTHVPLSNTSSSIDLDWFPKKSQKQLILIEVSKIKDEIHRLINLDSIDLTLEEIYFQDQIYRDSINTVANLDKPDIKRLYQKMELFDKMNSEIAIKLLRKSSWPKTKRMSKEAQEALCLVAIHNNTKELNQLVSAYLDRAYYIDSSFSAFMFAAVSDRLSLRAGGDYIYGTLRFKKEKYNRTEIAQINKNRSILGLDNL
ncbi:hypothetical protein [Marivirga sp.]|uniref:hypothetical protein n=1 Tax=Marivirga sp. TaxID=2018662 RepID=UPI0025F3F134|nr:hypothetical protein [Marivirga sp.]